MDKKSKNIGGHVHAVHRVHQCLILTFSCLSIYFIGILLVDRLFCLLVDRQTHCSPCPPSFLKVCSLYEKPNDREPLDTPRLERLVFVNGDSTAVVTAHEKSQQKWGKVATAIECLLHDGYRIGCDMNVSWNGRYDAHGQQVPKSNYMPYAKPTDAFLDGHYLCPKHDPTDYKAKWLATQQGDAGRVDEPLHPCL